MEQVNWGMIGVGSVTEVKSGPALYKVPNSVLRGVTSRTYDKAVDYAKRHGINKVYPTVSALLEDSEIDIVYIATPPSTHKEYTIQALRTGKHVYVEKPMALSLKEAQEMNRVAEESGRKLFVAFYRRALPYFTKVKTLIDEGHIGVPLTVTSRLVRPPHPSDLDPSKHSWRVKKEIGGEGYFVDLAPHVLDLLDYFFGPINEAQGIAANLAGNYEVPDSVGAIWKHEKGVLGTGLWMFSSTDCATEDSVTITGTKGEICFSAFDFKPVRLKTAKGELLYKFSPPEHIQEPLIITIVEELLGNGSSPSTGMSGERTAAAVETILSIRPSGS